MFDSYSENGCTIAFNNLLPELQLPPLLGACKARWEDEYVLVIIARKVDDTAQTGHLHPQTPTAIKPVGQVLQMTQEASKQHHR